MEGDRTSGSSELWTARLNRCQANEGLSRLRYDHLVATEGTVNQVGELGLGLVDVDFHGFNIALCCSSIDLSPVRVDLSVDTAR